MRRSFLTATTLVALFIAALVANQRLAGSSPIIWIDTFNDESEVQQCLANDSCTLTGVTTSLPGQVHAVAWLELRTLLAWLGLGLDGTHLLMQVLNALAAVLVFHLAMQLGGRLAGVLAVWIFMDRIEGLVRVTALHNQSFVPFLGAVFVLVCTAVVVRPGVVSVALVALVAAVMANVHLACVMTGASVVWVAVTAPRRRALLTGFGGALFALATIAMAPPTWLHNLSSFLQHPEAMRRPAGVMTVSGGPLERWALFAVVAWVASFARRARTWVEYRRRLQGPIAVIVPFLVAFLAGPRFGLHAEAKYLLHLKAACAIAAALPLAIIAGAILQRLLSQRILLSLERMLPFALALALVLPGRLGVTAHAFLAEDERTPTVADLAAVVRILHDERGWDVTQMLKRLKTPYGIALLRGLPQVAAGTFGPRDSAADDRSSALLLMVDAAELPDPLPSRWRVVRRSSRSVVALVFLQSRIDWSRFEVCVQAIADSEPHCKESGWRFDPVAGTVVPNMPRAGQGWRGTLQLRVPLLPASPGLTDEIFMPRLPFVCGGRIASPSGGVLHVDAARRYATVSAPEIGAASLSSITLEWEIGAPECDGFAYDGLPPFFVEGDAATVRSVEAVLRKRMD